MCHICNTKCLAAISSKDLKRQMSSDSKLINDPAPIPNSSTIFLPFSTHQAQEIKARLEKGEKSLKFVISPHHEEIIS